MNKRQQIAAILFIAVIVASVIIPVSARYVTGGRRIGGAQILTDAIDSRHFTDDSIDDAHINWGTGANQVSATDINLTDCGTINSSGTITSSGIFDAYGAVAMTIGSVDITSMSFVTDGTTNTEFTFPADVIGDADIDWGTGSGQVSAVDIDLSDCAAITSTGTITSSGVFDATGAVGITLGSVDITDITFITDSTGNAEFTFPNDVIGDADIDWGTGSGQVSGADITYAEGDMTDSMIIGADIKDDTIDSADYAAGSIDAEHLADDAVTQTKLDTTVIRATLCYFINGNATTTMLASNEHPKMQLKSGYAQLIEIADATTKTYTVQVYNGSSDFMTDTLTFTQGTEGIADTKAFTIDATNHTLGKANMLNITTAGTTVTLGEMIVCLEYLGVD